MTSHLAVPGTFHTDLYRGTIIDMEPEDQSHFTLLKLSPNQMDATYNNV